VAQQLFALFLAFHPGVAHDATLALPPSVKNSALSGLKQNGEVVAESFDSLKAKRIKRSRSLTRMQASLKAGLDDSGR
jgi:hypothetical protein